MGSSSSSSSKSSNPKGIPHRFETLDLVVSSSKDFEMLASVLENLVEIYREERNRYDRDVLLLEHYWIELEKDLNETLSPTEWIILCDKLNVPLKRQTLLNMYKDAANHMGDRQSMVVTPEETDNEGNSIDGLSLKTVAELLEPLRQLSLEAVNSVDLDDPGTRIWNEIVATDPVPPMKESDWTDSYVELAVDKEEDGETISTVAFLSFIRSQQKEYRTALEDAAHLCQVLNRQVMIADLEDTDHSSGTAATEKTETSSSSKSSTARLAKSRFLSYLMSDANDLMDPTKGEQGTIDMTRPLSHYFINTSHDTYLARLPNVLCNGRSPSDAADHSHYEVVDEQMYWAALYRGVRCIELDVWDSVASHDPVVARKQPTAQHSERSFIVFSDVLRIVRAFLQQYPNSYPIILKLENHCTLPYQKRMAHQMVEILGNLLYIPSNDANKSPLATSTPLPSPATLRGQVVIMAKRPKTIRQGATVINDDFDDDNGVVVDDDMVLHDLLEDDDEDDDEGEAVIIGFNERGPIKKPVSTPGAAKRPPALLLDIATREASDAHREARVAERNLTYLKSEATTLEMMAAQLTEEAGFTPSAVRAIAFAEMSRDEVAPGGFEVELDVNNKDNVSVRGIESPQPEEGLEVQDFFGDAVEGAKSQYTEADAKSMDAAQKAALALAKLNDAKLALRQAERDLEASYQREKDLAVEAQRAASEARTNREHADTARRRVETVRELLRNCVDGASSAETVVVTAYTEAKISEQRASEAEARASRAMSTADKDRGIADEESRKEELLEQEVERLHLDYVEATKAARSTRERVEKATAMLERVNEQIKLIEQSSQYQKELREQRPSSNYHDDDSSQNSKPRHGGKFLDKHAAKLDERKMCNDLIKEASAENAAADQRRRRAQTLFEEQATVWRMQAERAATMRKQAERSSHIAEELAEHAEEEREAASLRHIAREKAQANVQQSDSYRASVEAQLAEAERAASEAASVAVESRNRAEQLARESEKAKNHTEARLMVEHKKGDLEVATRDYELAAAYQIKAANEAAVAKRLLETSSEVYSSAQRDAAAEIHRVNEDRAAKRRAVDAYNKALNARKAVDRAKEQFKSAKALLSQKNAALKHAERYKQKSDKIVEIDVGLATVTLLHTCKHKHWEKSLALPSAHLHCLAQGVVQQMVEKDADKQREYFSAFTSYHMVRTFPSWSTTEHTPYANYDPVFQWSLGCQLVAMNYNCVDERVLVADGRFRANGSSGYILKPDYLTDDTKQRERQERWKFSILTGSCLPKPESSMGRKGLSAVGGPSMHYVNPYVKVSVYDETTSSGKVVHATRPVARNGFNPVWKDKNDVEVAIPSPSLAIILFTVWDKTDHGSDDFIAAAALPVSCIREGYRSVALFDSMNTRCGPYAFASLLVKAQKLST